jgi:hypothetical protein
VVVGRLSGDETLIALDQPLQRFLGVLRRRVAARRLGAGQAARDQTQASADGAGQKTPP